jgi:hypothetical protein
LNDGVKIMTLIGTAGKDHFDQIDYLSGKASEAYQKAMSGTLNEATRAGFSKLAQKLHKYVWFLMSDAFHLNTAKYEAAKDLLDDVNGKLHSRLDDLEQAAQNIKEIAQILKLVDQALVIAAGVASMA